MVAPREPCVSPEEYLERERQAETKSEYIAGEIVAMAGATRAHAVIAMNLGASLHGQLRGRRCEVTASDTRVKIENAGVYTYPDVVVCCGDTRMEDCEQDTLLNPTVVIEVLSPSTEGYDRGEKFFYYRQLESLADYLLVSQAEMRVEHYARQPNGLWLLSDVTGPEGTVEIPSIDCRLSLADVYDRVEVAIPRLGRSVE